MAGAREELTAVDERRSAPVELVFLLGAEARSARVAPETPRQPVEDHLPRG